MQIPSVDDLGDSSIVQQAVPTQPVEGGGVDSSVVEDVLSEAIPSAVDQVMAGGDAEAPVEAAPEPITKPGTAEDRIRQLIQQRNDARDELQKQQLAYQQEMARAQYASQQQQAQFQQQQLELQRQQLAALQRSKAVDEDASLDPAERARRKFLSELKEQTRAELLPELQVVKQQLAQERQAREKAQQESERRQRYDYFSKQGEQVLGRVMQGYDPEDVKTLKGELEETLFSYAAAFGKEPYEVEPQFRQLINKLVKAETKKVARGGQAVARSQATPMTTKPMASNVAPAKKAPSLDQLYRAGFENHIRWRAAGSPDLP